MLDAGATPDTPRFDADEPLPHDHPPEEPPRKDGFSSRETTLDLPGDDEPAPAGESQNPEGPEASEPSPPVPPAEEGSEDGPSLEERVRRLEDIVAVLNLTTHGPDGQAVARQAEPDSPPARQTASTPPRFPAPPGSGGWLLFEIYAELRSILRLFLDPRYQLTWQTRLLAPLLIAGIVVVVFVVGSIPVVGGVLEAVLYPVLLYMLFKVLSREATHYRMTSPDIPAAWRL